MTYHIFVSGRVQGVGYRRFAQKKAESLSLIGWARNLLDGEVEIVASGDPKELDQFCDLLRQGPSFSQVREVRVKQVDGEMEPGQHINPGHFEIRPDPEMR
jgi:acylphosphatase